MNDGYFQLIGKQRIQDPERVVFKLSQLMFMFVRRSHVLK